MVGRIPSCSVKVKRDSLPLIEVHTGRIAGFLSPLRCSILWRGWREGTLKLGYSSRFGQSAQLEHSSLWNNGCVLVPAPSVKGNATCWQRGRNWRMFSELIAVEHSQISIYKWLNDMCLRLVRYIRSNYIYAAHICRNWGSDVDNLVGKRGQSICRWRFNCHHTCSPRNDIVS
jgi:hypothetical protein